MHMEINKAQSRVLINGHVQENTYSCMYDSIINFVELFLGCYSYGAKCDESGGIGVRQNH